MTDHEADQFDPNRTPGTVIGAVAAGTVVVPFLIVYAFLFIARGAFVQVDQPDITSSRRGETIAGLVALVFLFVVFAGMGRLLNGRGRWLFLLGQVITAGVCVDFLIDSSSGQPEVPAVVLAGSVLAIVFAVVPTSWRWVADNGGNTTVQQRRSGTVEADRTDASEGTRERQSSDQG